MHCTDMAREDAIRESMRAVGVYNEIFEPAIKTLAKTEFVAGKVSSIA